MIALNGTMRLTALTILLLTAFASGRTQPVFRIPVRVVAVPVTVITPEGKMLRDLQPDDFTLSDNDQPQRIRIDEAGQAFSIVIVIQNAAAVRAWLPEVSRSASVFEALVLGSKGEAAVLTFSDDVTVTQPMTREVTHLDQAFRNLRSSGDKSRCIDAVVKAVELLRPTPAESRRIIIVIAQAGDSGSKANLRDAVAEIERQNITVYCLAMPRVGSDLLGSIRMSGLSSAGGRDTGFIVSADLTRLIPEIYRGSKSVARADPVTLLTEYSGGTMQPFRRRGDLDAAISSIGEELHTGYLLTYTPNDSASGYHRIRVAVNRADATVRARPGYYASSQP